MKTRELNEEFEREIDRLSRQIKEKYKPEKIILFGSSIKDNITEDSDIDMLIIKETDKKRNERFREVRTLVRDLKRRIPFSPLVYTPTEIEQRLNLGDFFIKKILKEGKVLYER
jgi:predicted nucleotidyltransferase